MMFCLACADYRTGGFVISEALYNEGLRLLNVSPYLASFALRHAADCPPFMFCGNLIKAIPDVYICELKVHCAFFVELHAEPIEVEPFAEVGTTAHNGCIEWAAVFVS